MSLLLQLGILGLRPGHPLCTKRLIQSRLPYKALLMQLQLALPLVFRLQPIGLRLLVIGACGGRQNLAPLTQFEFGLAHPNSAPPRRLGLRGHPS